MNFRTKRGQRRSLGDVSAYIAAAYVSYNHVSRRELGSLIISIHVALEELQSSPEQPKPEVQIEIPTPQAIRRSVQQDYITSFIDGRRYKSLKRHLTKHGLDPRSYRDRYSLPGDYPMVAPGYAARRSEIAKGISFGLHGRAA